MTAADSLAIVSSTTASLADNFKTILPVLFPVVIVIAVLFYAWRKLHGLSKGRG